MPRLFVAIDVPPAAKRALGALHGDLPGARWLPPAQLHLTLRFLGDGDEAAVAATRSALARVALPAFSLTLAGTGRFPPRGQPRVLWVGVRPSEPLEALHRAVERELERAGWPAAEKRRYEPHVTVARLRGTPPRRLRAVIEEHRSFELAPSTVGDFRLYASVLRPQGALHEVLETYPLTAGEGASSP